METKIRKFIKHTPEDNIKDFLMSYNLNFPDNFKWQNNGQKYCNSIFSSIWNSDKNQDLFESIERIHNMSDELGQSALCAVIGGNDNFLNQKGEHARSLWVYSNHPEKFKTAEHHACLDYKRKSRQWNSFEGPKNKEIDQSQENITQFKELVLNHLDISRTIKVEFCGRDKKDYKNDDIKVVQLIAFHDGLHKSLQTFDNEEVVTKYFAPANEFSISYEPESGVIEVVSDSKDNRTFLAKTFANIFLKSEDETFEIRLKKYDLSKFKTDYDFMKDVDIEDLISNVKVTLLKLKPLNDKNSTTIESPFTESRSIYDVAHKWFAQNNPLHNSFSIKKVRLSIKFKSDDKNPRGKLIHVNITDPNGCDLKDRTEKEKLIGNKYLEKWSILERL